MSEFIEFFKKNLENKYAFLGFGIVIGAFLCWLFHYFFFDFYLIFDKEKITAEWASVIVGLIAAILVYLTFRNQSEQLKLEKIQRRFAERPYFQFSDRLTKNSENKEVLYYFRTINRKMIYIGSIITYTPLNDDGTIFIANDETPCEKNYYFSGETKPIETTGRVIFNFCLPSDLKSNSRISFYHYYQDEGAQSYKQIRKMRCKGLETDRTEDDDLGKTINESDLKKFLEALKKNSENVQKVTLEP